MPFHPHGGKPLILRNGVKHDLGFGREPLLLAWRDDADLAMLLPARIDREIWCFFL